MPVLSEKLLNSFLRRRLRSVRPVFGVALLGLVLCDLRPAVASGFSWSQEKISPPVGQMGLAVTTYFSPPTSGSARGVVPQLGSQITRVQVQVGHQARVPVETKLCWSDLSLCIPVTTGGTVTNAFNGRDARGPLVLVHAVPGKGPLRQPVFVRSSVSVWFSR